eukprot:75081_1
MTFIGREKQYKLLNNVLNEDITHNLVLVFGAPSSGKSLLLNAVLKQKNIHHVYMPCHAISSSKQFFHVLISELYNQYHKNVESKDCALDSNCKSVLTFVNILKQEILVNKCNFYIILDNYTKLYENVDSDFIVTFIETIQNEFLLKPH